MQSLRSLSNPRRWLSKRTADSGGSSSAAGGVVGLGALSDGDVLAQRELEAFLEQLCEEPDFGANVNSSNVSLLEKSKAQYSSTASIAGLEGTSGGFTSLPAQLDEASVLELITAFCRRRTVARSIAADLLARAATHLRTLPNVVEFTVPPGCFLTVVGGTLHAPLPCRSTHTHRAPRLLCPDQPLPPCEMLPLRLSLRPPLRFALRFARPPWPVSGPDAPLPHIRLPVAHAPLSLQWRFRRPRRLRG